MHPHGNLVAETEAEHRNSTIFGHSNSEFGFQFAANIQLVLIYSCPKFDTNLPEYFINIHV